jgi:hypothetical protein
MLTHSQIKLPPDHPAVMNHEAAARAVKKWKDLRDGVGLGFKRWAKRNLDAATARLATAERALLDAQQGL